MDKYRVEHDSMGEVRVPAERYWGAQTERSRKNFRIGAGKYEMPLEMIRALALVKKAAALANLNLGALDERRAELISAVCDEIREGKLDAEFPLVVFQTGSGTQTNMNLNEVIANRGNELAGERLLHPNDHVNRSQSSNDVFPTAMHVAAYELLESRLIPAAEALRGCFADLEEKYKGLVKCGRTHFQDAAPLTLGQEISAWRAMLEHGISMLSNSEKYLSELAIGGTAVGTGLNAPEGFSEEAAAELSRLCGRSFHGAKNKFHALSSKDAICFAHSAIRALAADLFKIANDVRMLSSGPRCGIGEIKIPENEPGSSIMPGKVNPTQCEALTMAALQVFGNDVTVGMAASQGQFQLNTYMPLIAYNFIESASLLSDAVESFRKNCAEGIEPNEGRIAENLEKSLMLVTALNPHIGYENAAKIAKRAHEKNLTLKEAAIELGLVTAEDFDTWADPENMV